MTTITLPFLDLDNTLTPLVIAAIEDGATSARIPGDDDHITLTFRTAAKAKAFRASMGTDDPLDDPVE